MNELQRLKTKVHNCNKIKMDANEKRNITRNAKNLAANSKIWFIYTPERVEYLITKVMQLTGKEPRIMPDFGTLNGKPVAEIRL